MIHDGIQFDADKNIVRIGMNGVYVQFGRICSPLREGSIKTEFKREGVPVYALPIVGTYSKTNMMYDDKGIVYLMLNGRCYKSRNNRGRYEISITRNNSLTSAANG